MKPIIVGIGVVVSLALLAYSMFGDEEDPEKPKDKIRVKDEDEPHGSTSKTDEYDVDEIRRLRRELKHQNRLKKRANAVPNPPMGDKKTK